MELKTRYQYTYFIHTFILKENKYSKYVLKLLKDSRFKLRIFSKDKDLEIYTNFLPRIRDFLFSTFELDDKQKKASFDELPLETRAAVLSSYPSLTFEYDLKEDIQGKTIDQNSIFFKIQKVGIVLFNTGICFLYLKTNIEDSKDFADVLNLNYKFRDINGQGNNLKNYENIKVQTDYFETIEELQDFIVSLTGPNIDALKLNLDVERFYTYSYTCINQDGWSVNSPFEKIKNEFSKYANIMSNDSSINLEDMQNIKVIENSKYSKIGISKLGINLLCSDCDINNYSTLPAEYENQYFYAYIISLYLKVFLKKLNYEFKEAKDIGQTRKKFIEFTKNLWLQEITSSDMGSLYFSYIKEVLEIDKLYGDVKNKYNILYSELKIEKNEKMTRALVIILMLTLICSIINIFTFLD